MKVIQTAISDVLVLEPRFFGDERGFFFESFNRNAFRQATGLDPDFVQDNHSRSEKNVLRGLHYQVAPKAQGKLFWGQSSMWQSIFARIRRASGAGSARPSARRTGSRCGSLRDSLTDS